MYGHGICCVMIHLYIPIIQTQFGKAFFSLL
jgi:hypothetical protein